MRQTIDQTLGWLKRVLRRDEGKQVIALLTPRAAHGQSLVKRVALVGGTVLGLALAGALGLVGFAALMFAVSAIYYLATQVLGLKIDVDPRAIYEQMRRHQAPSYGPN